MLERELVDSFVADQRHRGLQGIHGLATNLRCGHPVKVSDNSIRAGLNWNLKVMRWALDEGHAERLGLPVDFITAFPYGNIRPASPRQPFSDDVARALVDKQNRCQLAADHDANDVGIRDIWEAMVFTGRRSCEIVGLRLDCLGRYQGLPVLWHDQTKVGNFDEAVRIPERLYERFKQRQQTTLLRFEARHGRQPTKAERRELVLFPSRVRNPTGRKSLTPSHFGSVFSIWVERLDLGAAVPHQARHTLATRFLAAGADLHHLRRFLGHVSVQMTEHYAKISPSAIDDALARVWVAGPGAPEPGKLLATNLDPTDPTAARAMAINLSRLSTPAEGGMCTFQPVVLGEACPWKLDCTGCDHFVMSGADLVYWRRKREQWYSIAERAPDDATAIYLREVFAPTARAIDGLEQALAGLGLLDEALDLDACGGSVQASLYRGGTGGGRGRRSGVARAGAQQRRSTHARDAGERGPAADDG